jgi:hypothetical protein
LASPASPHAALQDGAPPAAPGISARALWRLLAPWLGYAFLGASAVLGLFTASAAEDGASYAAGLATFALAAIIIAVRMKRQFDGSEVGFLLAVSVGGSDALLVAIALQAVLGLIGFILAATVGGAVYTIGIALFIICMALIFIEIKRYFDRQDRGA